MQLVEQKKIPGRIKLPGKWKSEVLYIETIVFYKKLKFVLFSHTLPDEKRVSFVAS